MSCDKIRESLLAHLYEALEPEEERAVLDHLSSCAACRDALTKAKEQKELLGEAALLTAEDLSFTPPAPRGRVHRRPWFAAAAAVLVVVIGLLAYRHVQRAPVLDRHPRLVVQGPATISPDAPAELMVLTETIEGDPLDATVRAEVVGADAKTILTRDLRTEGGQGRIDLPPGLGKPGEQLAVLVTARFPEAVARAETLLVRDGSRLLARVSTDKPLYRPGEIVRARAVVLERFRLTPASGLPVMLKLLDPKGNQVAQAPVPAMKGVGAASLPLPHGAAGGEYRLVMSHPQEAFPEVSSAFTVRTYRVPRLKTDLELDRDSYGPGGSGKAYVSVTRVEGGVPEGARIQAVLTVDGKEVSKQHFTLARDGALTVPFTLPDRIDAGRGQIALTLKDGGVVEAAAKTIPISLDRLAVTILPEGGELVAGLPGRVYYSVRDPAGEPADLLADVVDSRGTKVAE
ncbi:MAG: anti-sigma factor family protein, partial [Planctomycetota bacterium]